MANKRLTAVLVVLGMVAVMFSAVASGQVTTTWNGTGNDWATPGNWDLGVPGLLDTAQFSAFHDANQPDLNGARSVGSLWFVDTSDRYKVRNGTLTVMNQLKHASSGTNSIEAVLNMDATAPAQILVTSGNLRLLNAANTITSATVARIEGGQLSAYNGGGTGNSLGSATVQLAGGRLQLDGSSLKWLNGFYGAVIANGNGDGPLNLDNAAYSVPGTGGYTGTVGLLSMPKGQEVVVTRSLNLGDGDADFQALWPTFGSSHGWDNYSTFFSGRFTAPVSGSYNFEWHCDDRGMGYIDLNGDGVFAASERLGNIDWNHNNDGSFAVSLTAGQSYNVVLMAHEWGGGNGFHHTINGPVGVGSQIIDPSNPAQAGWWTHLQGGGSKAYGNNVSVSASSTIGVNSNGNADLGALAMTRGTTLTLEGGVGFTGTTFNGPAGNAIFNTTVAGTKSSLGQLADGGVATVLIKRGLGELNIAPTPAANIAQTSFRIEEGILSGSAAQSGDTSLGGRPVDLYGGKLLLSAVGGVPAATRMYTFDDQSNPFADSVTGAAATGQNGAKWSSAGHLGGALDLTAGRNAHLTQAQLGLTGNWTISAWFSQLQDGGDWRTLTRGSNDHQVIIQADGNLGNYRGGFHGSGYSMTPLVGVTAWHQLVAVGSGGSTVFYIDGAPVGSIADQAVNDIIGLGSFQGSNQQFAKFFDDFGIWADTALTPSQITALYTGFVANYNSPVNVHANSEIESTSQSVLGALTLDNGATLTLTPHGTATKFASTTVLGTTGPTAVGVAVNAGTTYAGVYTQDLANPTTLVKSGAGYLMFEYKGDEFGDPVNLADNTTFQIQNGWMGMQADMVGTHTLPAAKYVLSGGGLIISATDTTDVIFDNDLTITGTGGSLEARKYNNSDTSTAVAVKRSQPITIAQGDLTVRTEGAYTMVLTNVNGPGNLIKTGDSTVTIGPSAGVGFATYTGHTTVNGGSLIITNAITAPNATSGITVNAGLMQVKGTVNIPNSDVTVNAGTFRASVRALTAGQVTVATPGTFEFVPTAAYTASLAGLNNSGVATFNKDLTIRAGGRIETHGTLAAPSTVNINANLTTDEILITGGDYNQPNTSLTLPLMTLTGGQATFGQNLTVNTDLGIIGGRLVVNGVLTAGQSGGNFRLSDLGILRVNGGMGLSGLPNFSVGEGVGHSGWLELGAAQTLPGMPVVTVTANSLLTGNTTGLSIKGDGAAGVETANVVLMDSAVFGGTVQPTTTDLGDYVRLQKAIIPNDSGTYVLGDDNDPGTINDIYRSAIYGIWSRSSFRDAATVQPMLATLNDGLNTGLLIDLNGERAPLSNQATFNSTTGVKFSGLGRLNISSAPLGTWPDLTREGDATTIPNTILQLGAGTIPDGKSVTVKNGFVWLDNSGQQLAATGTLNIMEGATLRLGNAWEGEPQSRDQQMGTVHTGSGGMLFIREPRNITAGATWTFDPGAIVVLRDGFNYDLDTLAQLPRGKGVTFVQDNQWASRQMTNFRLGNGDWFVNRTGDNSATERTLMAYQGAIPGDSAGIAATPGRGFYFEAGVDLRVNNGVDAPFKMDLKVGSRDPLTTLVGDWNLTRWTGAMTGDVWFNGTTYAGNVEVQGGQMIMNPRAGNSTFIDSVRVVGSSSAPYAVLNMDRANDGTTQSFGHLEVGGPGSWIYLNDFTWNGPGAPVANFALGDALVAGTLADEIVINDRGSFYFRLRPQTPNNDTVNGVGAVLRINEQIRFTGRHADDSIVFNDAWRDDNRRDLSMSVLRWNDGNVRPDAENRIYMPNIILDQTGAEPVVVAIRPDQPNEGQRQLFMGLTFRSNATTTNLTAGLSGGWDVVDAVSAAGTGPHTWFIGQTGEDPMVQRMFGVLGGDMTANVANGSLTMMSTSTVQSGASLVVGAAGAMLFQNFANNPILNLTNIELMGGTFSLAAGQAVRAVNAKFGGAQDMGNLDIQFTHGVVAPGGVVSSVKDTATSTWEIQRSGTNKGQLTLVGNEALQSVTAFTLAGGKLTIKKNAAPTGTTYVGAGTGANLSVTADSELLVDRETGVGGSNRWLTFGATTFSAGTVATTVSNGYGLAFGTTNITGASAGFSTNGPASFASIDFAPGAAAQTLALAASEAWVGPLTGSGNTKHLTFTGGALHLTPGNTWAGDLRVSGASDRLMVDNDLSGYALAGGGTTISVLQGITELLPGSAGTSLAGIKTASIRFSDAAIGTTGPLGHGALGAVNGQVILNTPEVDASFLQANGSGGTQALRLGAATIRSEQAGNIFSAPLTLAGTTTLGNAAGGGQDFALLGVIGGSGNFVKVGSETVTLGLPGVGNENTYVGTTSINNGTIVMNSLRAFGAFGNAISVNGANSALSLGVAGANFGGGAGGYSLNLTGGAILDVAVNGVDLQGVDIDGNTLRLSNTMEGAIAPIAPVTGKTILNTPSLHSDYSLGLSGTIVANMDLTTVASATDKANTIFQIASGRQITINGAVALTDNRTWEVSSLVAGQAGVLDVEGDVTGNKDLVKAGPGTLILGGAGNVINKLTIGASPGGTVILGSLAAHATTVVIGAGSLYTVDQANYDYHEVDAINSAGVVALSQYVDNTVTISFAGNTTGLSLGAFQDSLFAGTLTPGNKFRFGGGPATLTVNSPLAAGKDAQFGWPTPGGNDPLPMGKTILLSATDLNGAVDVYQHVGILNSSAFGSVAVGGVAVHPGGAIDLGNLLLPNPDDSTNNDALLGQFNLRPGGIEGGSVSNVGGSLFPRDITALFGGTELAPGANRYYFGSDFDGATNIYAGLVNTGGLTKVGTGQVNLPYSSTYSGTTVVKAGTLYAPDTGSFGNSTDVTIHPGATLMVDGSETGVLPAKVTMLGGTFQTGSTFRIDPLSGGADAMTLSGASTINAGATLTVGKISAPAPLTLTLNGPGVVDLTDVTNALTSTATLRVEAGRLVAHNNANGTQNSLGTSAIEMAGGELYLNVIKEAQAAGLAASYYNPNVGNHNLSGTYNVVPNNTFTGTAPLLAATANFHGLLSNVQWNQPVVANMFPGSGISATNQDDATRNNYMILWTGTFTPTASGTYSFWGSSDDACSMWMDVNKDGTFTDGRTDAGGERIGNIGWNTDGGSVTLTAGQSYNVAFTTQEGGGGDWSHFWMQFPGAAGTVDIFQPGTGQDNLWSHLAVTNVGGYGNNVAVTAPSTITVEANGSANMGSLTMLAGSALTTNGSVNFTSGRVTGTGPREVVFNVGAAATSSINALNTTGGVTVFQKMGPGTLRLTDTTNVIDNATTLRITEGQVTVAANSAVSSMGQAKLNLDGGTLFVKKGPNEVGTVEGLMAGVLNGDWDVTTANPNNIGLSMSAAGGQMQGQPLGEAHWRWAGRSPDHTTLVYTGQIYLPAGDTSFFANIDDGDQVLIGGGTLFSDNTWNSLENQTFHAASAGWYNFEVRFGNGTGGYGGSTSAGGFNWGGVNYGFGMRYGGTTTNATDYFFPMESVDGTPNLFRVMSSVPPTVANMGSDVTLTGNSVVDAELNVSFHSLTAGHTTSLSVLPTLASGYVRFDTTTLDGDVTFNATGTLYPGQYTQAPGGSTINATGSGYVVFDHLATAPVDDATTLNIVHGWVGNLVNGSTSALPSAVFQINGGGLVLSAATAAGGTNTGLVNVVGTGGTIEARAYGANAASGAITVYQSGVTTIDAGAVLTAFSAGNYDLRFTNNVTGGGELRTSAGKVSTDAPVTVNTLWAKGGQVDINNTATVNTLKVEGGRLNAFSLLTASNVTVTNNGILSVDALGALMGLPAFTVATGPNGPGWLNFGVAQTDIPVITVDSASVVTGDTSNLRIRGFESPDQASGNLILKNGTAFYGTLEPTTEQLGSGVRLQAALTGNDSSRLILVGDDGNPATTNDIYSGAIYGIWSRSNFENPATGRIFQGTITDVTPAQLGVDVNINNEITTLDAQARFNTTNTDTGVRFFGPGKLTMSAPVGGTANTFSRTGTSADLQNNILALNNGSVAAGDHWLVANGRIVLGGTDAFVDKTSHLTMQAGSTMNIFNMNPNKGTIDVLPGAIVYAGQNTDMFLKGAANQQWNFTAGVPTQNPVNGARNITPGGILALIADSFDPVAKNFPNNIQFIFTRWDNGRWPQGFPLADGAYIVGELKDNLAPAHDNNRGIIAAATAHVGDTVGFAEPYYDGNPGDQWQRTMEIQDPVNLRIGGSGTPDNAMNLVIGNTERMWTINGTWSHDITRSLVPMSGRVSLRATLIANDVHVQSGALDFYIDSDKTAGGTVGTKELHVNNLYSWGGWRANDGDGTSWHDGSHIWIRRIDNFNVGGRSIAGSIYSRGGSLEIWEGNWNLQNALATDPAGPNAAQAFANQIVVGNDSRFFYNFHPGTDPKPYGAGTTWIMRTPVRIEAETSHSHFGWNVRFRRDWEDKGAGNNGILVDKLIMEQGSILSVRSQWENDAATTFNLFAEGDALLTRRWNGWDGYQDDSWDYGLAQAHNMAGRPITLTIGQAGQPGNLGLWIQGTLGDAGGQPITMKTVRGSTYFLDTGALANNVVLDDRGIKHMPDYVDGVVIMQAGVEGGTSMPDMGGTILIGSDEDAVAYVRGTWNGTQNRINKVLGHIEVVADSDLASRDARIQVQRVWNGDCRVVANWKNVQVDNNALVEFQDIDNGNLFADVHSPTGATGLVFQTDVNRFYFGDIGKPGETGAVKFVGNNSAAFYGNVYGELVWATGGQHWNGAANVNNMPEFADPAVTPLNGGITVTPAELGYAGFALTGGTLNMGAQTLTMSNTMVNGHDIGTGNLKTSGSGSIIIPEPASIPNITGLIVAGGTMRVQSDSATAWTQPVTAMGTGSGTLQVEPVTAGGTGQAQSFPSLTFRDGTPGLTVSALNGATASFGHTDALASATGARLVSQIPNLDIGPVTIAAGANLKLGSAGAGSIRTASLTGPVGASFGVGPMGGSNVTITGTAADFLGTGVIEAGTLHLTGPSLAYNGTLRNEATLHVAAGSSSDLSNTFINSTVIGTGTSVTGIMGNYYSFNTQDPANAGGGGLKWFQAASGANSPEEFMNSVMPVPTVQQLLNTSGIYFPAGVDWAAPGAQDGNPFASIGVNVGNDNIVAFWTGFLTVPTTGTYNFGVNGDDGKIVIVDGQMAALHNVWTGADNNHNMQVWGGNVSLTAGVRYPFTAGFFEGGGGASVEIHWRSTDAGVADAVIPISAFTYGTIASGGTITVDSLGSLTAQGFTEHKNVNVNGTVTLLGPGNSDSLNGLVTGSLLATGGQDVTFKNSLTVSSAGGSTPSINMGTGTLRVGTALTTGTANINTPFAFGPTNKTTVLGTMNVAANPVTLGNGAVLNASTVSVAKDAKLAVNNGSSNTIGQVEIAKGGSMDLNNAGNQNGMAAIHNLGTVTATAGTTDLSNTVITSTKSIIVPIGVDVGTAGDPSVAGTWSETGGVYTLTGSGSDIWSAGGDHFFYLHTTAASTQDITMTARIVSLTDLAGNPVASDWAKAGLMVRDSTDYISSFGLEAATRDHGVSLQVRPVSGVDGGTVNNEGNTQAAPVWVRLDRNGTTGRVTGYWAPDLAGVPGAWTMQDPGYTATMTGDLLFGLAVSSHSNGNVGKAVFDNFSGFGTVLPGDITVADGATLLVKGFTTANTVTVGPAGRLELKSTNGADWSDCISLALDATAKLDIGKAGLKIVDTTLATVRAEIAAEQITSGMLAQNPTDWRMAAGVTADGVQVKVTILGDVNMDKVVDRGDLASFTFGPTDKGWTVGDFNYDGSVDWMDYVTLKDYMGRWFGDRGEAVPEPATLGLLAFGLGGLLLKRRNRK